MLALRKTAAAPGLSLAQVQPPRADDSGDEILVQVLAAGICGSDLHVDRWAPSYGFIAPSLPLTLGHEFVGIAQGGALRGQRVVVRPSVTCGVCAACRAGEPDRCGQRRGIGLTRDGAFAPWVRVPLRNCVPVPQALSDEVAALAEPFTVAWQALRQAGELRGRHVLVLGPGTIGQAVALLAREAGAVQVVVSGRDDALRLGVLRALGFEALLDTREGSLADLARPWLPEGGFDVVIEATGVPEVINEALALLRPRGIVVVCGIHARPLALDLASLVRREQQLRGSLRASEAAWPEVLALIGRLANTGTAVASLVSHALPLAEALQGFALAHARQACKVMIKPGPNDD